MGSNFTKGPWEVCEHSWSDKSVLSGDKTICTISIYDEATEETQEELGCVVSANFNLIAAAPLLLEALQYLLGSLNTYDENDQDAITQSKHAINAALGIKGE